VLAPQCMSWEEMYGDLLDVEMQSKVDEVNPLLQRRTNFFF